MNSVKLIHQDNPLSFSLEKRCSTQSLLAKYLKTEAGSGMSSSLFSRTKPSSAPEEHGSRHRAVCRVEGWPYLGKSTFAALSSSFCIYLTSIYKPTLTIRGSNRRTCCLHRLTHVIFPEPADISRSTPEFEVLLHLRARRAPPFSDWTLWILAHD